MTILHIKVELKRVDGSPMCSVDWEKVNQFLPEDSSLTASKCKKTLFSKYRENMRMNVSRFLHVKDYAIELNWTTSDKSVEGYCSIENNVITGDKPPFGNGMIFEEALVEECVS